VNNDGKIGSNDALSVLHTAVGLGNGLHCGLQCMVP
jgi:hypothetical protein